MRLVAFKKAVMIGTLYLGSGKGLATPPPEETG